VGSQLAEACPRRVPRGASLPKGPKPQWPSFTGTALWHPKKIQKKW